MHFQISKTTAPFSVPQNLDQMMSFAWNSRTASMTAIKMWFWERFYLLKSYLCFYDSNVRPMFTVSLRRSQSSGLIADTSSVPTICMMICLFVSYSVDMFDITLPFFCWFAQGNLDMFNWISIWTNGFEIWGFFPICKHCRLFLSWDFGSQTSHQTTYRYFSRFHSSAVISIEILLFNFIALRS